MYELRCRYVPRKLELDELPQLPNWSAVQLWRNSLHAMLTRLLPDDIWDAVVHPVRCRAVYDLGRSGKLSCMHELRKGHVFWGRLLRLLKLPDWLLSARGRVAILQ